MPMLVNFLSAILCPVLMITYTALVKKLISLNIAKVAGLGRIFIQQNFWLCSYETTVHQQEQVANSPAIRDTRTLVGDLNVV
jgi:hypothetical protein